MIREYVKTLSLPHRGNCPICGHYNTFTANIQDGWIIYNCYSASCKLRGKAQYELSLSDIRLNTNIRNNSNDIHYIIPDYYTNPLQNSRNLSFLKRWELLDSYARRDITLFYDPKQERCVFLLKDFEGNIKGAVGRGLYLTIKPKWYIYERLNDCPFVIHPKGFTNEVSILVEDCISAVNVANSYPSMALLGTNIPIGCIKYIQHYKEVIIALDKDATQKSVKLQKQLAPFIKASILPLEKDLKYLSKQEIEKEITNVR